MSEPTRSWGGRTRDERVAERRRRLVAATVAVLAERGEAQVTMTRVCRAAGLTERYFYESFPHLDDALVAALDAVCDEITALVQGVVEKGGGSPRERVGAVMNAFVAWVVEHPAEAKVAVVHASGNPRLRARRHQLLSVFADLVATRAAEMYGADAWPPARARVHALVYVAGFAELVASWLSGEVDLTPRELEETAGDLLDALVRRPG